MPAPTAESVGETNLDDVQIGSNEIFVEDCRKTKGHAERQASNEATATPSELPVDTSSFSTSENVEVLIPPDGGWGWVIVYASFMCNLIVDGIIFSFGTFLNDIATDFAVSKAHVTLVGSLMSGFYLIAGPFASALANRYSFRLVAVLGAILGAISFAVSYFATSVQFLCITYGVLGGIGFGFIYVPAVITTGFYFERWRALATGIAVCGSGIGTFLFAPISEKLISSLGWRTALLIQGSIVFTCLFFGLLLRPLKPSKVKNLSDYDESATLTINTVKMPIEAACETEATEPSALGSLSYIFGMFSNNYDHKRDVYHTISSPYSQEKRLSIPFATDLNKPNQERGKYLLLGSTPAICPQVVRKLKAESAKNKEDRVARPMYRDDIFFTASLNRLPQYISKSSLAYNLCVTKMPVQIEFENKKTHSCKLFSKAFTRTLTNMLDFKLLKSPSFLILAVGGFFTMMGFYVPFMYVADRAMLSGMNNSKAVLLVSCIGIANTVGRVLCGVLSSFPGVNALFVTNAALTLGGVATIFSGISLSEEYQFFYTVVFGLSISCFASLRPIIVVDLLGLDKLTNAFGLLLLFQGVAAIIGAPLAGAFMDVTGSYDASFYLSGGLLLSSAIMCYPLNWINRWEKKRRNNLQKNQPE